MEQTMKVADHNSEYDFIHMPSLQSGSWSLDKFANIDVSDGTARINAQCTDILDNGAYYFQGVFQDMMSKRLGVNMQAEPDLAVRTCNDTRIRNACSSDGSMGSTARSMCPVTCGCASPLSDLILDHPDIGCPRSCAWQDTYDAALSNMSCDQLPAAVMIKDARWITRVNAMVQIAEDALWKAYIRPFQMFRNLSLTQGCDAIDLFRRSTTIDLCEQGDNRPFPFRSFKTWCPVTCKCSEQVGAFARRNCPAGCFSSSR